MKNILFRICAIALSFLVLGSCRKEIEKGISINGRILDAYTKLPYSNYRLQLSFIDGDQGVGSNIGSYSKIATCVTDKDGNYTLTTNRNYALDSSDFYRIEPYDGINFNGFNKELNAQSAEALKHISIEDIELYKTILAKFTINYSGILNYNSTLHLEISGKVTGWTALYNGIASSQYDMYDVAENVPTILKWQGIKDSVIFGPYTDTVIFTKTNNSYSISY